MDSISDKAIMALRKDVIGGSIIGLGRIEDWCWIIELADGRRIEIESGEFSIRRPEENGCWVVPVGIRRVYGPVPTWVGIADSDERTR